MAVSNTGSNTPRVYGGFGPMPGGMDGGRSPSLLDRDEFALGVNASIRGSYATNRPILRQHAYSFADSLTQTNWTGIFQGEEFFESDFGQSGWVISRGGHLFFLNTDYILSEITPKLPIATTAAFTVPAIGSTVDIFVNDETPFSLGQVIIIDSGQYVITGLFTDEIEANYSGGAANATVPAGASVQDENQEQIIEYLPNPSDFDFVHIFQAENYMIILCDPHKTIIFDGSVSRQANVDEIPPGVIGCYGWGRIWVTLADRRSFVAGNLVFDEQGGGTAQNNFRDSILKFTDNDFLNGGGAFGVPFIAGKITAMQFLAALDTSLGQGVLLVGTTKSIFSVNAPVDRATWQNLRYPIQTIALIGAGPKAPRSSVSKDGDMWFRSKDGIRSFVVARRDFGAPGNVPQSQEVTDILQQDAPDLLFYSSGVEFDNRLLMTVSPFRTTAGVQHRGIVSMIFDPVSNLRLKDPPCWEGFWTGLNFLQLSVCEIEEDNRAFAFIQGSADIELWEILSEIDGDIGDTNENVSDGVKTICRTPIQWAIESRADPHGDSTQLKSLRTAELYVAGIAESVKIVIKFRPDQYPTWITWATINLCASVVQCFPPPPPDQFTCAVWQPNVQQYASRMMLPQPPESCAVIPNVKVRNGREFQFRVEVTGNCQIRAFISHCNIESQPTEGVCAPNQTCQALQNCDIPIFGYDSHGTCQTGGVTTYYNTRQCQTAYCPLGQTGNPVTYCVEAGLYSSTTSQAAADALAVAAALQIATSQLSCTGGGAPCSTLVPKMTGPTTPSGVASASTSHPILPAWMAFDRVTTGIFNRWKASGDVPQWLQYQFASGQTVKAYRIRTTASTWTFQGSNNGSTWTDLDTRVGQPNSTNTPGLYLIPNVLSFLYYRLYITQNVGGGTGNTDVTELELFACQNPT